MGAYLARPMNIKSKRLGIRAVTHPPRAQCVVVPQLRFPRAQGRFPRVRIVYRT